jgi:hypothetical protein
VRWEEEKKKKEEERFYIFKKTSYIYRNGCVLYFKESNEKFYKLKVEKVCKLN